MKDDNLPPDNETVEDGGGNYVAGSREEYNAYLNYEDVQKELEEAKEIIKECHHYLKANPPDKTKMTYNKWQSLIEETKRLL